MTNQQIDMWLEFVNNGLKLLKVKLLQENGILKCLKYPVMQHMLHLRVIVYNTLLEFKILSNLSTLMLQRL